MTDRKLLEDVRDALKPMADELEAFTFSENHDPIGGITDISVGHLRACATTLARVEAALAETEEVKVERVARVICESAGHDPDEISEFESQASERAVYNWHFFQTTARAAIAAMGE